MTERRRDVEARLPLTHLSYQVLLALATGPLHGYAMLRQIETQTEGLPEVETGTLYAAIKRLVEEGLIGPTAPPVKSDSRRRYYRLTELGRRVSEAETFRLERLVGLARKLRLAPRHAS